MIPYDEITGTFTEMQDAFDDADSKIVWRNLFLTAFVTTYALNLVDVLISKPETGERTPISVDVRRDEIRVVKTFNF